MQCGMSSRAAVPTTATSADWVATRTPDPVGALMWMANPSAAPWAAGSVSTIRVSPPSRWTRSTLSPLQNGLGVARPGPASDASVPSGPPGGGGVGLRKALSQVVEEAERIDR